jgi:hypothetical protein
VGLGVLPGLRRGEIDPHGHGASRLYKATWWEGRVCIGGEGKAVVDEAKVTREKARRVLQAAAVEAYGRPGAYVTRDPVMRRARVSDLEEFWAIARYLADKEWIAEADDDYGIFVVTPAGVEEAMS